jgi:hypothetical protein
MNKNIKLLLIKIDKNLHKRKTKYNKKINIIKGSGAETVEPSDPIKEAEVKQLEDESKKNLEALELNKKLKHNEKTAQINEFYKTVDNIIDNPSVAEQQMNILLGASMNINPEKIKEGAKTIYEVLQTVDKKDVIESAKAVSDTAPLIEKSLSIDSNNISQQTGQITSPGSEAVNTKSVVNSDGAVTNGVKSVASETKTLGAELLKNINSEESQKVISAVSSATGEIAKIEKTVDTKTILNALAITSLSLEPIIEIGASIPGLGVCLLLLSKLLKQYREYKELNEILEDVQNLVHNSILLIKLIKTTIGIYQIDLASYYSAQTKLLLEELQKTNNTKDKQNFKTSLKLIFKEAGYLSQVQLNPNVEAKISTKVKYLLEILKRLIGAAEESDVNKSRGIIGKSVDFVKKQASKLKTFFSRFGLAKFYKKEILKTLNIINNLLITYNSQFDWAQSSFVMRIKDKTVKNQMLLDLIWTRIESSEDFKNYLWRNDVETETIGGRKTITKKKKLIINSKKYTIRKK